MGAARGAVVLLLAALGGGAAAAEVVGDPAAGAREFKSLCGICHTTEEGGASRVGPNLHGIVGAPAGRIEGFFYSPAHRDSGLVFTLDVLDAYIADPQATVPGTKKVIAGIDDAQRRADIIAYIVEATR